MNSLLQSQFMQVALPIMVTLVVTIWTSQWSQNKRFDDLNGRFADLREDLKYRFDDINRRFDEVSTPGSNASRQNSIITKSARSGWKSGHLRSPDAFRKSDRWQLHSHRPSHLLWLTEVFQNPVVDRRETLANIALQHIGISPCAFLCPFERPMRPEALPAGE